MKVKMFSRHKPLQKNAGLQDFENEVNLWLSEHSGIDIQQIKQSASGGSFNPSEWLITVWYTEPETRNQTMGDGED